MSEWWTESFGSTYRAIDEHEMTPEEVETIMSLLELPAGARLLDLCCGYGRHAIPLAERGFQVVGVDISKEMLETAMANLPEGKRLDVSFVEADMRDLPFEPEFDAAMNLFTSFGYFENEMDDFGVLEQVAKSLKTGGRFLIDVVNRDSLLAGFAPRRWQKQGDIYVLEENFFDLERSRIYTKAIVLVGGREEELNWSVRLYTAAELSLMLRGAGMYVIDMVGDWDESAYTRDSSRMIIVAEKV
ncbi:MAG: class I SAM-dependent methyltransferase [Candidatus Aquicultorales bacterium]